MYIGETGNLHRRLMQHWNEVNKGHAKTSPLAEHRERTGHVVDWNKTKLLTTECNLSSRLLLESLIVQTTPNIINIMDGNLHHIYANSLRRVMPNI